MEICRDYLRQNPKIAKQVNEIDMKKVYLSEAVKKVFGDIQKLISDKTVIHQQD